MARSAECWIHVDVANTPRRRAAAAYQRVSPQPRFRWSGACPSVSTQSAPEGIRTPNLLIRSQMLYPLSYGRQTHRRTTHRCPPRTSAKTSRAVRRGASLPAYPLRRKSAPPPGTRRHPCRQPAPPPTPTPTPPPPLYLVRGLTRKGPNAGMPPARHRDTVVTTAAFGWLPGRHLSFFPPSSDARHRIGSERPPGERRREGHEHHTQGFGRLG